MAEAPGESDPLAAVRAHVRDAQRAAERLAHEAGRRGPAEPGPAGPTPPSGWQTEGEQAKDELRTLTELLESLRSLLPAELAQQLNELIRQVLLLVRAIIDWLVARLEHERPGRQVTIEDIPIG